MSQVITNGAVYNVTNVAEDDECALRHFRMSCFFPDNMEIPSVQECPDAPNFSDVLFFRIASSYHPSSGGFQDSYGNEIEIET